jgi:3',5'-cyclic-AMP phosphodiesterase
MRIIQITDLHINSSDEPVNGVDTRLNFIKAMNEAHDLNPEMLVITGDLCYQTGNTEVYKWIKRKLENCGFNNYKIIGGNHDDIISLADVFGLSDIVIDGELFYFIEPDLFFLDTAKGYCNQYQLDWFKENLSAAESLNPLIFMHHPPFKAGVPHMDNSYAYQQSDLFKQICLEAGKFPYVFCGHYHNEITVLNDGISVFITPSTYLQIGMKSDEFEIDHTVAGFRVIDINNNKFKTTVRNVFDK